MTPTGRRRAELTARTLTATSHFYSSHPPAFRAFRQVHRAEVAVDRDLPCRVCSLLRINTTASLQPVRGPLEERKGPLMAKRMIFTGGVLVAIVAALGFVKFKQIQVAMAEGAAFQPPSEAVTTVVAQEEQWPATLRVIGTVAAFRASR